MKKSLPFAKLVDTDMGQILSFIQEGDDGLEVVTMIRPDQEMVDVIQTRAICKDDAKSRKSFRKKFASLTEEDMKNLAKPLYTLATSFVEAS